MPIPFIVALLGAAAGIGGHMSAKETNEKADIIFKEAKRIYDEEKLIFDQAKEKTQNALLQLAYSKKNVLETSIKQFLPAYERIKHIQFKESVGINELSNFSINEQDVVVLRNMVDIYDQTFKSTATSAAAGALVSLAAGGATTLSIGMTSLSTAGSLLAAGELSMATSMAGSAMASLTTFAAPVLLFSGVSASLKADENLDKAKVAYAEAEAAVEKMKTAVVMCEAIGERASMFDELLQKLNCLFAPCTSLMDGVTLKKKGFFGNKKITSQDLTGAETNLISITGSLAKAIKSIIDTPILSENGELTETSYDTYQNMNNLLPDCDKKASVVLNNTYSAKPIPNKKFQKKTKEYKVAATKRALGITRNILAVGIAFVMAMFMQGIIADTFVVGLLSFTTVMLLLMNTRTKSALLNFIKILCLLGFSIGWCILFYNYCGDMIMIQHYIIICIIVGVVSLILAGIMIAIAENACGDTGVNNLTKLLLNAFGQIFFYACGILVYAILVNWIGIPSGVSAIITVIAFGFFSLCTTFASGCAYNE